MRLTWAWLRLAILAFSLSVAGASPAQAQNFGSRTALLDKARAAFDTYMFSDEFEGAKLARAQSQIFPANWARLRNRFAEASVDKLQGKVGQEATQRRYLSIIGDSLADVEASIISNRQNLGLAQHDALVRWERALNDQLRAHLSADPQACNLSQVLQRPASPQEVGTKVDLIIAYWKAFGSGATSPVKRAFETVRSDDAATLAALLPSATDRRAVMPKDGELAGLGSLGCADRLSLSNALLAMSGEAQDRLIAHSITRVAK